MHNTRFKAVVKLTTLAALIAVKSSLCSAGPVATVGANVPAGQQIPVEHIDHSTWDVLLKRYVDTNGMVDYAGWKSSPADRQALNRYLAHLSAASITRESPRETQLAYWINAYNAVTIEGILREYPTTSIRNHTAKVVGYNIWKDLQLLVDGKSYSLEQIEHEILRKMGEPRIHFAIVCASIGCPRLLNQAYTAEKLDAQLTANAEAFFADRDKFRFDARRQTIAVSPILDWFAKDFGTDQAAQMRRISRYLQDPAARQLAQSGNARVSYLEYDWGLNEQSKVRQASIR